MGVREDYQALMERQLNEWKVQTERLKSDAEQLEALAKVTFDKNLELLRAKHAEARLHLIIPRTINDSAWTHFKTHIDASGAEVKTVIDDIMKALKG